MRGLGLYAILFLLCIRVVFSQGTQQYFGKNRIQYHNFEWSFYKSDNFVTYFYLGGQEIEKYVVQQAEKDLALIEKKVEFRSSNKIEILVFNDISDLRQSNIGIGFESYNTGGLTKIVGNRIFVYFDGDHDHLKTQIRQGIAQVLINDMMYGGNIQEVVQNAVLLSLPAWFMEGIVSYMAEDWSFDLDNQLRDGILSGKFEKVNKLNGRDSRVVGHSLSRYIVEKYGKSALPSLLYLTRLNRNLESGFAFVLGGTVNKVLDDWYNFYYNKYKASEEEKVVPGEKLRLDIRTKKHKIYSQLSLSADTNYVALKQDDIGRYKIKVYDRKEDKIHRIEKGGYKTITQQVDKNYPILEWHPTENKLAILYEKRDQIKLLMYNFDEEKKKDRKAETYDINKFQRISSMEFVNEDKIVISAINRGVSDIYTYHIPSSKVEKLTNDYYDDRDPTFFEDNEGRKGILFVSNRTSDTLTSEKLDTTLPEDNFDIYYYDYNSKSKVLTKITNTAIIDEVAPQQYGKDQFSYLSNVNGIQNRVVAHLETIFSHNNYYYYFPDTTILNPEVDLESLQLIVGDSIDSSKVEAIYKDTAVTYPTTNYATSILEEEILPNQNKIVQNILYGGKSKFYLIDKPNNVGEWTTPELTPSLYFKERQAAYDKTIHREKILNKKSDSQKEESTNEQDTGTIEKGVILPHYFQSDFTYPNNNVEMSANQSGNDGAGDDNTNSENNNTENPEDRVFESTKVLPYRLRFASTEVTAQLDNTIIFGRYQPFTGGPVFQSPGLNPLIQVGVNDILEDYKLVGGFRVATNLSGAEYFGSVENLKHRIDRKLVYYRSTSSAIDEFGFGAKKRSNYTQLGLTYPFDVLRSLRGYVAHRNDRIITLASDEQTLNFPDNDEHWSFVRMEYVLDNTIDPFLNLHNGVKYKVYAEYHKQWNVVKSQFTVLGFDFRWYQRIDRKLIWANRISGATSFGTKQMVYYLGGVDNWMGVKFDDQNATDTAQDYAFQTLATNMRGFIQNARNGNSNVVINSEIRCPIFTYLFNKPIKSEFLRVFQIALFGDVGAAWTGPSPFDQENPFNSDVIGGPPKPITIRVDYFQNPVIGGFGFGARSMLFGYFIRADVAWGVDNSVIQKPVFYLSMSLDF